MPRNYEEFMPKKKLANRLNKEIILQQLMDSMDTSEIINVLNGRSEEERKLITRFFRMDIAELVKVINGLSKEERGLITKFFHQVK